jgi:hypothetical protein
MNRDFIIKRLRKMNQPYSFLFANAIEDSSFPLDIVDDHYNQTEDPIRILLKFDSLTDCVIGTKSYSNFGLTHLAIMRNDIWMEGKVDEIKYGFYRLEKERLESIVSVTFKGHKHTIQEAMLEFIIEKIKTIQFEQNQLYRHVSALHDKLYTLSEYIDKTEHTRESESKT